MIVDSAVYRDGCRLPPPETSPDGSLDVGALRASAASDDFVWIGLHDPTPQELQQVADAFDLHSLAVEDALHPTQRPKLERYERHTFIVLKTLWYLDDQDAVETGQVAVFIGPDYVITCRQGEGVELAGVRASLEQRAHVLGHGPAAVLYAVCDRVVDGYEAVVAELENDVEEVEESVFSPRRTHDSQRIYVLKRELMEVRRAVHPLRAPVERMTLGGVAWGDGDGPDPALVPEEALPFFRDVADHLARVSENVDSLEMLLSAAFEAHLARIQVQQNEDMRKISAWVALAAVSTLVAGIYGMNFDHMPELRWRLGYPGALGLMVLLSALLYRAFKRSGWL